MPKKTGEDLSAYFNILASKQQVHGSAKRLCVRIYCSLSAAHKHVHGEPEVWAITPYVALTSPSRRDCGPQAKPDCKGHAAFREKRSPQIVTENGDIILNSGLSSTRSCCGDGYRWTASAATAATAATAP